MQKDVGLGVLVVGVGALPTHPYAIKHRVWGLFEALRNGACMLVK